MSFCIIDCSEIKVCDFFGLSYRITLLLLTCTICERCNVHVNIFWFSFFVFATFVCMCVCVAWCSQNVDSWSHYCRYSCCISDCNAAWRQWSLTSSRRTQPYRSCSQEIVISDHRNHLEDWHSIECNLAPYCCNPNHNPFNFKITSLAGYPKIGLLSFKTLGSLVFELYCEQTNTQTDRITHRRE